MAAIIDCCGGEKSPKLGRREFFVGGGGMHGPKAWFLVERIGDSEVLVRGWGQSGITIYYFHLGRGRQGNTVAAEADAKREVGTNSE